MQCVRITGNVGVRPVNVAHRVRHNAVDGGRNAAVFNKNNKSKTKINMLQFQVIGNIGGNAELHKENGNEFVSFKVAHNERYTDAQGNQRDTTIWVSCILNGNGGNLFPYLVKGQQVYVSGDGDVRTYHSAVHHQLVAGLNVRVRQIQLIGNQPEPVPSRLYDADGVEVRVNKYYQAVGVKNKTLNGRDGTVFSVDKNGWISKPVENQEETK